MNLYVNCANCGKQVISNEPDSKCYWCGNYARYKYAEKKEVTMEQNIGTSEERAPVPRRPKQRLEKLWGYFDQHKEAIIADYRSMTLNDFYKRWHITSSTWLKLKKKWEVPSKGLGGSKKKRHGKTGVKVDQKGDKKVKLTEHERYLILVGYQMAVREFLKADKNHA